MRPLSTWAPAASDAAASSRSSEGASPGPQLSGKILGNGADWQTITHDGLASLEARYAFQTDDGAIIEVFNQALRHGPDEIIARMAAGDTVPPDSYYMRSSARLETGHPDYTWLNRMVFVGTGARTAAAVQIELYVVE